MKSQRGFSAVTAVLLILVIAAVGSTGWYIGQKDGKTPKPPSQTTSPETETKIGNFATPKKGAHFETSTPAHASTQAAVPVEVVLDFNFDLADNSTIEIIKEGKDYGTGSTTVDDNKLALRRQMDKNAPDGVYTVNYNGCWPDRSCHDGHFQFAIDRGQLSKYEDMGNQKAVTIKMSEIKFKPMNLRLSSGTTVTWINDDGVEHYVNTDSHPAHSHVPDLNSKALAKGASYSFTFTSKGAYPYHCSAHASDMTGNIVVE